jgi:hypothetical protein
MPVNHEDDAALWRRGPSLSLRMSELGERVVGPQMIGKGDILRCVSLEIQQQHYTSLITLIPGLVLSGIVEYET